MNTSQLENTDRQANRRISRKYLVLIFSVVLVLFTALLIRYLPRPFNAKDAGFSNHKIDVEKMDVNAGQNHPYPKHVDSGLGIRLDSEKSHKPAPIKTDFKPGQQSEIQGVQRDLELVLSASINEAVTLSQKLSACNHSEKLLLSIDNGAMDQERLSKIAGVSMAPLVDQMLVDADRQNRKCQRYFGRMNGQPGYAAEELLDSLEKEAVNGNTIARFLYAMWTPRLEDSVRLGEKYIKTFEQKADAFTTYNETDAPELWLLALGFSYSAGENFTPIRLFLGSAYLLAAKMCGVNHREVELRLAFNESAMKAKGVVAVADIQLMAQRIAAANC